MEKCYVCRKELIEKHNKYHRLCKECGQGNLMERERKEDLSNYIALITGGRVKIGYYTSLKLIRAGAKVIVTTRFPLNALNTYSQEKDFEEWKENLIIYEMDLKKVGEIESFIQYVQSNFPKLDIIINNAAQTIKKSKKYYAELEEKEENLSSIYLDEYKYPQLGCINIMKNPICKFGSKDIINLEETEDYNSWVAKPEEISLYEFISIRIYIDFVDKCYKITKRTPKVLIKNTFDKNIFASIYNYLVTEIKQYEVLDDEDKVRKILNKYKVRVDFTKRKNSYAYTSNHIVLSKEANLKEFLIFLEKGNSIVIENFLNYFPYYILNIAEIRFRLHFHAVNGKTLEQINNYYKEKRHKDSDLCYLLKELKPAKPRYIIDKLKSMKYVDINRQAIENKEYVKFSIDLNNRNVQKNYLMDIITSRGRLVYNYTNSHIKY